MTKKTITSITHQWYLDIIQSTRKNSREQINSLMDTYVFSKAIEDLIMVDFATKFSDAVLNGYKGSASEYLANYEYYEKRIPKKPKQQKTERYTMRLSDNEKKMIVNLAKERNTTITKLISDAIAMNN
jgi:hypothetical protein